MKTDPHPSSAPEKRMSRSPAPTDPSPLQNADRHINTQEAYEQLAQKLHTTTAEIKKAADRVGPNAREVEAHLLSGQRSDASARRGDKPE